MTISAVAEGNALWNLSEGGSISLALRIIRLGGCDCLLYFALSLSSLISQQDVAC